MPPLLSHPWPGTALDTPGRSPAALAIELLNDMAALQDEAAIRHCRDRALSHLVPGWPHLGILAGGIMRQLELALEPGPVAAIIGPRDDPRTLALQRACRGVNRVGRRVFVIDPEGPELPVSRPLQGLVARYRPAFGPAAYLQWRGEWEPAPSKPEEAAERLERIGRTDPS